MKRCPPIIPFIGLIILLLSFNGCHTTLVSLQNISPTARGYALRLLGEDECLPKQKHCYSCYEEKLDGKEYCDQCEDNYLLDITQTPYKCIECPEQCGEDCTPRVGCNTCNPGFFKTEIVSKNKFETKIYVCQKCSEECKDCETAANNCTECPEYYKLVDKKCKFAYFKLIYIGIGVVLLVIIFMVVLIIKCICLEKRPEKPNFGSILDKDPDLQSDHIKYDMKTIGAGR